MMVQHTCLPAHIEVCLVVAVRVAAPGWAGPQPVSLPIWEQRQAGEEREQVGVGAGAGRGGRGRVKRGSRWVWEPGQGGEREQVVGGGAGPWSILFG